MSYTPAQPAPTNDQIADACRRARKDARRRVDLGLEFGNVDDNVDYRAMLVREMEKTKAGAQRGPIQFAAEETHFDRTARECLEGSMGRELYAEDARRYCYHNVYQG